MIANEISVPLRWADADAYGHVHHATFLTLIEHARVLWLLRTFGCSDRKIWDHATLHLTIDYVAELLVEDGDVRCGFEVTEIGTSSITLSERMTDGTGTLVAKLKTVVVAWVPEVHKTRPLTSSERMTLAKHAGPDT